MLFTLYVKENQTEAPNVRLHPSFSLCSFSTADSAIHFSTSSKATTSPCAKGCMRSTKAMCQPHPDM